MIASLITRGVGISSRAMKGKVLEHFRNLKLFLLENRPWRQFTRATPLKGSLLSCYKICDNNDLSSSACKVVAILVLLQDLCRDHMRDYMDTQVTLPKQVTTPTLTWAPPPHVTRPKLAIKVIEERALE